MTRPSTALPTLNWMTASDPAAVAVDQTAQPGRAAQLAVKVPEIAALFWVIKVVSTAMGEALSDFLDGGAGLWPVVGVLAALIVFVVALRLQLGSPRYNPALYWFAVGMVATFGTMAADSSHQAFGIPYYVSSAFWLMVLTAIFCRWYSVEGTLSIHSINTKRRERYYWCAVLATFALGTAVGDMTATNWNLGFLASALMFTGIILIPAIGWWKFNLNPIIAFWFAYILTRPLGASYADWMDVPKPRGLGFGTGPTALVLMATMVGLVTYVAVTGKDRQREPHQALVEPDDLPEFSFAAE
jgi:uncharacterized membrane-anchored protein